MSDRNTERTEGKLLNVGVAGGVTLEAGKMAAVNVDGYAIEAADTTSVSVVLGRIEDRIDNSDGADGAESVDIRRGVFKWDNDGLTLPGQLAYVKDDETVSNSTGTAMNHVGHTLNVETDGVWVEHDFA